MVKKSYWHWQCKLSVHWLPIIFSLTFCALNLSLTNDWCFLISSSVWTIKLPTTFTHIVTFTHIHKRHRPCSAGARERSWGLCFAFFLSVSFVKPSEGQRRMWSIFVTIKATKSAWICSDALDERALLLACCTPLGGRTVVRGHLCFLCVTVPSGDVWSCFRPSVKSWEESSFSDMTSFEWWTSLSPFFLLPRLRGFVQFLGGPGLEGSTIWVWSPEPTATPRFMEGLTVPERLLVCDLDSETVEEQLEKSSMRSSLRSFPTMLTGAWQPTEEVEPLNLFNHSQSERALQSHDQGLSLRRKYSKAGSMSRHCPDNSTRVLLNK